jgi:putative addiction module component (TIGR02574 family)
MPSGLDEQEAIALQLHRSDRARLLEKLLASFNGDNGADAEEEWLLEVKRRAAEASEGVVQLLSAEAVTEELRSADGESDPSRP